MFTRPSRDACPPARASQARAPLAPSASDRPARTGTPRLLVERPAGAVPAPGARRNLFVVRSLVQMLNAIEAGERFGLCDDDNWLLLGYRDDAQMAMHRELLAHWPHFGRVVWHRGVQLRACATLFAAGRDFERLVVGNWTQCISLFLNRVARVRDVVLVDDGVAGLRRIERMATGRLLAGNREPARPEGWIERWRRALGLYPDYADRATLFLQFDVPPVLASRHQRNDLDHFRRRIGVKPRGTATWFVGNAWRDRLRTPDLEDRLFEATARCVDLAGAWYVPHPKEDAAVVEATCRRFGMRPWRPEASLEIELLRQPSTPARVLSFGSSAVTTLHRLAGPEIVVLRVPSDALGPSLREQARAMYAEFERAGHRLVELPPVSSVDNSWNAVLP